MKLEVNLEVSSSSLEEEMDWRLQGGLFWRRCNNR